MKTKITAIPPKEMAKFKEKILSALSHTKRPEQKRAGLLSDDYYLSLGAHPAKNYVGAPFSQRFYAKTNGVLYVYQIIYDPFTNIYLWASERRSTPRTKE